MKEPFNPETETRIVRDLMDGFSTAIDQEKLAAEEADKLREFTAPDGKWKYAPASERKRAEAEVRAEQLHRAGIARYYLERRVLDVQPLADTAVAESRDCGSVADGLYARAGGHQSNETYVLAHLLEQVVNQNQRDASRTMSVVETHSLYRRVTKDDTDPTNRATIRYIEQHGYQGPPIDPNDKEQTTALHMFNRAIRETREARVPPQLRELQDLFGQARKLLTRGDLLKVRPVRPDDV